MLYVVFFFMVEQPLVGQDLLCTVLSVRLNGVGVKAP